MADSATAPGTVRTARFSRRGLIGGAAAVTASAAGVGAAAWFLRPSNKVRLLFTNDIHSHLRPVYHREANGEEFLQQYGLKAGTVEAYLTSSLGFLELARQYGKVGGLAQVATIVQQERSAMPDRTLLLDAGDTWYGSGIGLLTEGRAMVQVMNEIGYDAMTLHWEFNFGKDVVLQRIKEARFAVLAQNLVDEFDERVLPASLVRNLGGTKVGVIGQAYPLSLLTTERRDANAGWRMGYQEDKLGAEIQRLRREEGVDLVVVISHMGYQQERVIAEMVPGIDVIVGGHTHDILWRPDRVGSTLIVQAGSHGKFLGELDLDIRGGKIDGFQHRLIPVLSERVEPHPAVKSVIDGLYQPFDERLGQVVGETATVLYRRSLFGGTTDALMTTAYRARVNADAGCAPGWRFGTSVLPGPIVAGDVYDAMKPTPSPLYGARLEGRQIRAAIEDNLDNVFNPDPLLRLGGEALRCSGVTGDLNRAATRGSRVTRLLVNGAPIEDRQYLVATSGGRTQYLAAGDQVSESAQPAVEELIGYIRDQREPIKAEPIRSFVEAAG